MIQNIILGLVFVAGCVLGWQQWRIMSQQSDILDGIEILKQKTQAITHTQQVIADSIGKIETTVYSNVKKIKIYK